MAVVLDLKLRWAKYSLFRLHLGDCAALPIVSKRNESFSRSPLPFIYPRRQQRP
ncbi:hypothetical protein AXFE_31890 [Acidithrix ferrooxidans]|uniref:Uncharacterized protein n=1 Tax=Acidithrix ferrooxidans TaxID=1280514 RepID=A0A0D8HDF7_9ACTN|nr:hypothetical protein AXFE_31890 [Acidithrix ferrooxidans]CAG4934835.1 unnamed protein product [Acidithrix sp. C25]